MARYKIQSFLDFKSRFRPRNSRLSNADTFWGVTIGRERFWGVDARRMSRVQGNVLLLKCALALSFSYAIASFAYWHFWAEKPHFELHPFDRLQFSGANPPQLSLSTGIHDSNKILRDDYDDDEEEDTMHGAVGVRHRRHLLDAATDITRVAGEQK